MSSDSALIQHIHSMRKKIAARQFFDKQSTKIRTMQTRLRNVQRKMRELTGNMDNTLTANQQKALKRYKETIKKQRLTQKEKTSLQRKIDKLSAIPGGLPDEVNASMKQQHNKYFGLEKAYTEYLEKAGVQESYDEHISAYVDGLRANKEIKPEQENTVREILTARFNERGMSGVLQAYKNFSLIDTMGNTLSAITQVGDLAWVMYEAGLFSGGKNIYKAVTGQSKIKKADLMGESIAQEFADGSTLGNWVTKIFKWTGLEKMDAIGKESLLNSSFDHYKKQAQKNPSKLKNEIRSIFEGETDSVIQDLLNDDVTDNVKVLVYHRLLDFQPVSLSEMPEKYLTAGNGRIFYTLKTFTLKQFDIFRREVYKDLRHGDLKQKTDALIRFTALGALFVVANAGADEIKDWLLGRKTDMEDRVVDNMLRLFGVSKFITWQARTEGTATALLKQILPPVQFIDSATRDIISAGDDKGLSVIKSVPIVGKLAYWHIGKGKDNRKELAEIRFSKERKRLAKAHDRYERSKDKTRFAMENRQDLLKYKSINNVQGRLNQLKSKINKLKALDETPERLKRIDSLESIRIKTMQQYFERGK